MQLLEVLDRRFGDGTEVAVDGAETNAVVPEMGDEPFLEEAHIVAFVAALEVGSRHRDRLLQASAVLLSSSSYLIDWSMPSTQLGTSVSLR